MAQSGQQTLVHVLGAEEGTMASSVSLAKGSRNAKKCWTKFIGQLCVRTCLNLFRVLNLARVTAKKDDKFARTVEPCTLNECLRLSHSKTHIFVHVFVFVDQDVYHLS